MAEDAAKAGGKSKFLSKSKWGRVFREREEHEIKQPEHSNSFKLNDDVADFLKPSTDKAASNRPKIDIAIAQRWPDAHEVRSMSAATPTLSPPAFVSTKPKRRKGLTVTFVRTVPEIMGEGGDEAMAPVTEISRVKALLARSFSERRPDSTNAQAQQEAIQTSWQSNTDEDGFAAQQTRRRAQTSADEVPIPIHRRQASLAMAQPEPAPEQPRLSRTPTGFHVDEEHMFLDGGGHGDGKGEELEYGEPSIDTRFLVEQPGEPVPAQVKTSGGLSPTAQDRDSLMERRRSMRSSEGMALRRASAMMRDDDEDDDDENEEILDSTETVSEQKVTRLEALPAPVVSALWPEMTDSPDSASSPNPFADPKYIHSNGHGVPPPAPRQPQGYQTKYARTAPPPPPPHQRAPPPAQAPPIPIVEPPRIDESATIYQQQDSRPSYMRHAEAFDDQRQRRAPPPVPQVQSPPQPPPSTQLPNRPRKDSNQLSYTRAAQAPSSDSLSYHPGPPSSQSMGVPSDDASSTSRSPMREQTDGRGLGAPTVFYNRSNGSSTSFNRFPPSPQFAHSPSSSRDGNSSPPPHFGPKGSQSPSWRYPSQPLSPHNQSPRSSTLAPSPQDRSPSSGDNVTGRNQAARMSATNLTQRPLSSGSARSFQNFSLPRNLAANVTHPQQSTQPATAVRQEDGNARPASFSRPPSDYFTTPRAPQNQSSKSPLANLRQEHATLPSPSNSIPRDAVSPRDGVSPLLTPESNPAADAAYADFASRVAHMKGVFRLTAEKELPADKCTPEAWLRTAVWWYLRGKAGLEAILQQRRGAEGPPRELLLQPHVDLAKTWWILSDPLEQSDPFGEAATPRDSPSVHHPDQTVKQSLTVLLSYLKLLTLSMGRNQLMPPYQSLIQGQDTRIWLPYPRFASDAAAALGGNATGSLIVEQQQPGSALDVLPLGDTRNMFCYGRFFVEVSMSTDEADTDRVTFPCILSILRDKRDYLTNFVLASQNDLVNIKVAPRQGNERGLTWRDVSWKASAMSLAIQLPRGFDLTVRMHERDFRSFWNVSEYSRKVEHNLCADKIETLVHETPLAELQYADSSGSNAFPPDKVRRCMAMVFERNVDGIDGNHQRKRHRGYRLVVVTEPGHKSLCVASHEVCGTSPLFFEFMTDSAANGMAAMVVRVREEQRQCRILLVFADVALRQAFYDVLTGLAVGPREEIIGKMNLAAMNIEPATQNGASLQPALASLEWQRLGVTNGMPTKQRHPDTIMSESLRIVALHATGCVTDRLNLDKGELLIRLPNVATPTIQLLRMAQPDMSMSLDTRHAHPSVKDGIAELLRVAHTQPTVRTLTFTSPTDLHAFQAAVTGFSVRFDGLAAFFSIARRRMVVPIYKKWEATRVRLQVVASRGDAVVNVLAFMQDFSHADAMCFQVKSTDVFETKKDDKRCAVRLVDAKFSLPSPALVSEKNDQSQSQQQVDPLDKVRRRFVNLEGLDYAEEHDDITVGFDTEEERDRFAQALPAPTTTVGKGISLKRRI